MQFSCDPFGRSRNYLNKLILFSAEFHADKEQNYENEPNSPFKQTEINDFAK